MKKSMFGPNGESLLSPGQVAALRILIAAMVFLPVTFRAFKKIKRTNYIWLVAVGALGNLIPAFLFTYAEQDLSSSYTGMLNSLVPIFSVLVSTFIFKHHIKGLEIGGVLLGFIGSILLIIFRDADFTSISIIPVLLVVTATLCYAISLNIIKEKLEEVNSVQIAAASLFFMIPGSLLMLLIDNNPMASIIEPQNLKALGYTSILAIFGTSLALIIFNNLIKMSTATFASSVTYLIPFVAIIWGIVFNEPISWSASFILLILGGIYLVKSSNRKK